MQVLRRLRRLKGETRGAALVELTLLLPLLLSLMCGLAEFGQILRQYHLMDKGVRDAARYMARVDAEACPAADADWNAAVAEAQNLAVYGKANGAEQPLLDTWDDPSTVTVTLECLDNQPDAAGARPWRGGDQIGRVTVTASADYVGLGLLAFLSIEDPTLTVSHNQLVIGG